MSKITELHMDILGIQIKEIKEAIEIIDTFFKRLKEELGKKQ